MMPYSAPQVYVPSAYTGAAPSPVSFTRIASSNSNDHQAYGTLIDGVHNNYVTSPDNRLQTSDSASTAVSVSQHYAFHEPNYIAVRVLLKRKNGVAYMRCTDLRFVEKQSENYRPVPPFQTRLEVSQDQHVQTMNFGQGPHVSALARGPTQYGYNAYVPGPHSYTNQAFAPPRTQALELLPPVSMSHQRPQQRGPQYTLSQQQQQQSPWQGRGREFFPAPRPSSSIASREGPSMTQMETMSPSRPSASVPDAPVPDSQEDSKTNQRRSSFVLWCGNVPANATVSELWRFFAQLPPEQGDEKVDENERKDDDVISSHGIVSIFVIARSNCAFVNYATESHLHRALAFFSDKPLRPDDPRCPRLVCRIRKKEDEAQAGVAGQRGRGIHVAYAKEYDRKFSADRKATPSSTEGKNRDRTSSAVLQAQGNKSGSLSSAILPPELVGSSAGNVTPKATTRNAQVPTSAEKEKSPSSALDAELRDPSALSSLSADGSRGSSSLSSTNSSLLRHDAFRERFFILKSLRPEDLERAVETSTWATQPHNEAILDQAFRNSATVYLIFSANQSGGFFGLAKMSGAIKPVEASSDARERESRALSGASRGQAPSSANERLRGSTQTATTAEASTEQPKLILPDASSQALPMLSPQQLTPLNDELAPSINPTSTIAEKSVEAIDEEEAPEEEGPTATETEHRDTSRADPPPLVSNNTWPGSKYSVRPVEDRRRTLSPNHLSTTLPPEGAATSSDLSREDAFEVNRNDKGMAKVTVVPATKDEDGIVRKDMVGNQSSFTSKSSGQGSQMLDKSDSSSSLDPSDSISMQGSEARAANQVAIAALIHNLRLEEREAALQAQQLQIDMDKPKVDAEEARPVPEGRHMAPAEPPSRPFSIQWIKTTPLPFTKVRRLRNPWRDNRQIKVSRDGTELEPGVGRQLLAEWAKIRDLRANSTDAEEDEGEEEEEE